MHKIYIYIMNKIDKNKENKYLGYILFLAFLRNAK